MRLAGPVLVMLLFTIACDGALSPFEKTRGDHTPASAFDGSATGTLVITFNQTQILTVLPSPISPEDLLFYLTLSPGEAGLDPIEIPELLPSHLSLTGIPPGLWNISLKGSFPEGTTVEGATPGIEAFGASSQEPLEILAGQIVSWNAELRALREGTGSVEIELSWIPELSSGKERVTGYGNPSLQRLRPGQVHDDPINIPEANIDFDPQEGTLRYHRVDSGDLLESGFYRIVIPLERYDAGTDQTYAAGAYRDVIHIYDGRRSKQQLDITQLIGTPPQAPGTFQVSQTSFHYERAEHPWDITLSWDISGINTAAGYRLYRAIQPEEFDTQPLEGADSLSRTTANFTDQAANPAPLGTGDYAYQYRVAAWNSYGETPSTQDVEALRVHDLGSFLFIETDENLVLAGYAGNSGETLGSIPEEHEGKYLRHIAEGVFSGLALTGPLPEISEGIESIGREAFSENSFDPDVTIPGSVASIGDGAFRAAWGEDAGNVSFLTFMGGHSSLVHIGDRAFSENRFTTDDLSIPHSVTTLGAYAFGSEGETPPNPRSFHEASLQLPYELEIIGAGAFRHTGFNSTDQGTMPDLSIPGEVNTIGEGAFEETAFTGHLFLGDLVRTIGVRAFRNVPFNFAGEEFVIPATVEEIGSEAFAGWIWEEGGGNAGTVRVDAVDPPAAAEDIFGSATPLIRVPSESVDAYKGAPGWSHYSDSIISQ